jgi:hypothetical protein
MGGTLHLIDSCAASKAFLAAYGAQARHERVFSTHWSVVDHLQAHGVACRDVSSFTPDNTIRTLMDSSCRELHELLRPLDAGISAGLCRMLGLPEMDVFDLLYRYHGQYHLTGARLLSHWADAAFVPHGTAVVHYWHQREAAAHPVFSFLGILRSAAYMHGARLLEHPVTSHGSVLEHGWKRALRLALAPRRTLQRLRAAAEGRRGVRLHRGRSLAVVFQPEKQLGGMFARHADTVLVWPREGVRPVRGIPATDRTLWADAAEYVRRSAPGVPGGSAGGPVFTGTDRQALQDRLVADFTARLAYFMAPAVHMQRIHDCYGVTAAGWTVPLVGTPSRLASEALMRQGVPVAGLQHGGCYLSQHLGEKHFMTDFAACTHFISYAADQECFEDAYSAGERRAYGAVRCCTVLPGGNADHASPRQGAEPVDVVFPVTNAVDLFWTCRTGADRLARAQCAVLEALEARTDLRSIVKPFPHASRDSIAVTSALRGLRHAQVVQMGWRDFLERYRPSLAVIEFPSTPLYEALAYDMDIFLLTDPTAPFTERALRLLERRVHVFHTADELTQALLRYSPQQGGKLRDTAFSRAYVNTACPLSGIESHLAAMMAGQGR